MAASSPEIIPDVPFSPYTHPSIRSEGVTSVDCTHPTASGAKHITAKLSFDDGAASGPKMDVEFDAALIKEVSAP